MLRELLMTQLTNFLSQALNIHTVSVFDPAPSLSFSPTCQVFWSMSFLFLFNEWFEFIILTLSSVASFVSHYHRKPECSKRVHLFVCLFGVVIELCLEQGVVLSGSVALLDYSCITVEAGLWGNVYILKLCQGWDTVVSSCCLQLSRVRQAVIWSRKT